MDTTTHGIGHHDSLELFLALREAEGLAPATLTAYRIAVTRFGRLAGIQDTAPVRSLTEAHVARWIGALRRAGLAPGSIRWHQRHTYTYLRWLFERGELDKDIRRAVRAVKVPQVRQPSVDAERMARLLTVASHRSRLKTGKLGNPQHYYRNIALLRFLWATGLRAAEVVAVDIDDVNMRESVVLARHTKGKRERLVPFDAPAKAALLEYVARERGREPGPLFQARDRGRLTTNALDCVLWNLGQRCGFSLSAHQFRRGFAARVRRQGLDIGHTARLLGHRTLVMVQLYSQEGEEDAAISKYRELVG